MLDVETGASKKVGQEPIYGPVRTTRTHWAPDSKWLAYTLNTTAAIQSVRVYSIEQDKSFPITDGLSEVSEPVFDESGKYLFFLGVDRRRAGQGLVRAVDRRSRATQAIYLAVLRNDLPSPLAKESDEEKGASADEAKKAEEKKNRCPGLTTTTDAQRAAAGQARGRRVGRRQAGRRCEE